MQMNFLFIVAASEGAQTQTVGEVWIDAHDRDQFIIVAERPHTRDQT